MIDHPASRIADLPNDFILIATNTRFYATNAGFPSYFGFFRKTSKNSTTASEVFCPPQKTANTGCSPHSAPCMAIV
jgi:hypothetical protein